MLISGPPDRLIFTFLSFLFKQLIGAHSKSQRKLMKRCFCLTSVCHLTPLLLYKGRREADGELNLSFKNLCSIFKRW